MKVKESTKSKGGEAGASLDPDDAVVGGGLFGAGTAKAVKHRFGFFDYNGKRKPVPALLVTFTREGESHVESLTVGNGWKPSSDGLKIIPKAGQTGLNDNCKCMLYLSALKEAGMPKGFIGQDVSVLDGIVGELVRKPLERISNGKDGDDKKAGTVLVFDEVAKAPWGKGSKKAKPADDDDDADESEDEEETEDEDEEDEDDEKPVAKSKGKKAKPAADEDDDEDSDTEDSEDEDDEDEDDVEAGVEALIGALDDGPLKLTAVEGAVLLQLKKHPKRKAIAKLVASEGFAAKEKGWSWDKKKKTVSLD